MKQALSTSRGLLRTPFHYSLPIFLTLSENCGLVDTAKSMDCHRQPHQHEKHPCVFQYRGITNGNKPSNRRRTSDGRRLHTTHRHPHTASPRPSLSQYMAVDLHESAGRLRGSQVPVPWHFLPLDMSPCPSSRRLNLHVSARALTDPARLPFLHEAPKHPPFSTLVPDARRGIESGTPLPLNGSMARPAQVRSTEAPAGRVRPGRGRLGGLAKPGERRAKQPCDRRKSPRLWQEGCLSAVCRCTHAAV